MNEQYWQNLLDECSTAEEKAEVMKSWGEAEADEQAAIDCMEAEGVTEMEQEEKKYSQWCKQVTRNWTREFSPIESIAIAEAYKRAKTNEISQDAVFQCVNRDSGDIFHEIYVLDDKVHHPVRIEVSWMVKTFDG